METTAERWAGACVVAFGILAVLSVIGGIVTGLELSKVTTSDEFGLNTQTTRGAARC